MLKKILLGLFVLFLALQFFRPAKNLSAAPSPHDLLAHHAAPTEVKTLLAVACYDCHSNHTRYPWYAEIQPLGWWLADHVKSGKAELNFSEFANYPKRRAVTKLEQSMDVVEDRHMPLPSYTWTHADARLTDAQIKQLADWFQSVIDKLEDAE